MDFLHVWFGFQPRAGAAFVFRNMEKLESSAVLQVCSTQQSLSNAWASAPKLECISSPCPCSVAF